MMIKSLNRVLLACLCAATISCASPYDDSGIRQDLQALSGRVDKLEQLCAQLNTNLSSLETAVKALQQGDYVKNLTPVQREGVIIGYTIEFYKNGSITVYSLDGAESQDAPLITVAQGEDGQWYWKVGGDWLLDGNGNRVRASAVTPKLKIEDGGWYYSSDDGKTWEKIGDVVTGSEQVISEVRVEDNEVVFVLAGGGSFSIPRLTSPTLIFDVDPVSMYYSQSSFAIHFSVVGAPTDATVDCMASGDWKAEVRSYENGKGDLLITPGEIADGKVIVWLNYNSFSQVRALVFEKGTLKVEEAIRFDAAGGEQVLNFQVNCNYDYTIEYQGEGGWLTVSKGSTKSTFRDDSIIVTASPNVGGKRMANIVFLGPNGDVITRTEVCQSSSYPLNGKWYLGVYRVGANIMNFDGTEYVLFEDNSLTWGGQIGGSIEYYTIEYGDDYSTFVATNLNNGAKTYWTIAEHTDSRIVLMQGTVFRYFYSSQEEARNTTTVEYEIEGPSHTETSDWNTILSYSYGDTHSDANPMGTLYLGKHKTTESDRTWLADASNEPTVTAGFSRWETKSFTLYPFGDPSPADCNQTVIGDCAGISVLASIAYMYPDYLKHIIKDNGDNTYSVSLYDTDGNPVVVTVSNKVLCQSNGVIAQVTGKNSVPTWATVMEKALMKWESIYQVEDIVGIRQEACAAIITGNGDSFAFAANALYTSELVKVFDWCMENGRITIGGFNTANLLCDELYSVTAHAFALMYTAKDGFLFSMRNPWGNGGALDGVLNIPDDRKVVSTIDIRIISPGAAAPYFKTPLGPYVPPKF